MRILIFHGYLLSGTGSNVYNARLAEALVALGHEVHLLSQDRHADEHAFVTAVADWDSGALRVRELDRRVAPAARVAAEGRVAPEHRAAATGRCVVYRPNI